MDYVRRVTSEGDMDQCFCKRDGTSAIYAGE